MIILATLCYLQKNDKTLMIKMEEYKLEHFRGKWNGVGGKFKEGESPEECASREIFEETGFMVNSLNFCGFLTFPKMIDENDWYVFVYKSNDFKGKLTESREGKPQWIDNNDILKLYLWEADYIFIPWIFKNKFFSAKFIYKNGKLIKHDVTFPQD